MLLIASSSVISSFNVLVVFLIKIKEFVCRNEAIIAVKLI